jgi:ATP-dependent helicase/nuclease subunit A
MLRPLFRSTGYMPLYDLVSEAYARFSAFTRAPDEEATLAKLLETVKEFEGSGANSLREYLAEAAGDGDQWAISVPRTASSVRAMTVHKAKGLGFPVVIALLYGETNHGFPYAVLRDAEGARLVKITQDIAARDPELQALYDEEVIARKVDSLNGLYVALTRAQREMYVIGVKRERDAFPFDLLPSEGFAPSADKEMAAPKPVAVEYGARLSHETRTVPVTVEGGRLGREERRRGELVHRILALAGAAPADLSSAPAAAAARAAREAREDPAQSAALADGLARMIRETALAGAFAPAPGRSVLIEQEFCDETGRLFRMDRVVVDSALVTVIDFKTGAEDPAKHETQLRTYMHILSAVYPRSTVEALAAYVDHGTLREIR